jgi:hypothetical protein
MKCDEEYLAVEKLLFVCCDTVLSLLTFAPLDFTSFM